MGAKDVLAKARLVASGSGETLSTLCKSLTDQMIMTAKRPGGTESKCAGLAATLLDEEWHQKYAFIIGLLRKPHTLLVKESLGRERERIAQKLQTYRMERIRAQNSINLTTAGTIAPESLTRHMKHLDLMCVTLERQIDVLSNVDQALPTPENIYSGEPDSLDGTSSEILMNDEIGNRGNRNNGPNFQLSVNGRSPLDALAMLHLERCAHQETRTELNQLRKKYEVLRDEFDSGEGLSRGTSLYLSPANAGLDSGDDDEEALSGTTGHGDNDEGSEISVGSQENDNNNRLVQEVRLKQNTINQLRTRLSNLEKARIDQLPVDAAREIAHLHSAMVQLERVRDELTLQNFTLKSRLAELSVRITDGVTYRLENLNTNCDDTNNNLEVTGTETITVRDAKLASSDTAGSEEGGDDCKEAHLGNTPSYELRLRRKSTYKVLHNNETNAEAKQLRALINDLHVKESEHQTRISQLETEIKNTRNQLADESGLRKEREAALKVVEKRIHAAEERLEVAEKSFLERDEESSALKLDVDTLNEENKRLKDDLNLLHIKVEKEQSEWLGKLERLQKELWSVVEQNKLFQDELNKETQLRKKYFNMVEELKGKIRVFCRIRPISKTEKAHGGTVANSADPYTVVVDAQNKGKKEFQFDRVFTPDCTQEQIFADSKNLIKSAFDGFNVCICAYGQTGSGKTYTILGNEDEPGLAPRTFNEIFRLASDMSHSYDTNVSFYVLELYNDKLIDLLNPVQNGSDSPDKLEIRKDKRGTVWVSGARVLCAENSASLEHCFRQAMNLRHTATTKLNERSSRSHLILGLLVETTSKVNGSVLRGKISLIDLAGSERTSKSGVSAETLREANAINKSLSAFGDVINALTTEQSFVPYRNNKLTLLMQDSLGGNAKTLMFVNISPAMYNLEETITSLGYAMRVKQVTNGANRNSDSKEIARLKHIISRLKRGESCSADDEM